jgi:hypothetical protein
MYNAREKTDAQATPNCKPSGRRNVGRPRARWLHVVNKGGREIGIRRWWSRFLNREEWKTLLEEAGTLSELYS